MHSSKKKTQKHSLPKPPDLKPFESAGERLLDPGRMNHYWERLTMLVQKYGPTNSNVSLSVSDMKAPMTAAIDPMSWDIVIRMKQNLHFRKDRALENFIQKMNINDPFLRLIEDCGMHEIGHWEFPRGSGIGCPFDNVLYHESILQPAYEVLKASRKFNESFCKRWAERAANAVMDVINNHNVFCNSRLGRTGSGQVLFWYLNGQESGYSEEYTLFVKTNLAIWGNKEANELLDQFFAKSEKGKAEKAIGSAVARLVKEFTTERMLDRKEWEKLTRAYVKELVKFIEKDEEPELPTSAGDSSAGQKKDGNKEDKGQGKEESSSDSSGEKQKDGKKKAKGQGEKESGEDEQEQPGTDGNCSPFAKLSEDEKEQIMGERKDKGKGAPFYLGKTEALDALYRSLSKRIAIRTKKGDQHTAKYPAVPIRRRPFDPKDDDILSADSGKIYFDPVNRRLVPSVVTGRFSIDVPIKKDLKDFPGIAFALIDASGTMMGDGDTSIIPWGDKSGYHYAVLSFYGVLKQLEIMRLLHKVDISASIFHSTTHSAKGLAKCKELLLNPTSGGTYINIRSVREMLKGKKNALFPFISDGDIYNWDEVKEEFIALAKEQQFFMIKVFGENETTRDLRKAGLTVKVVRSYSDVVGLVVDLTARTYASAVSEKLDKESKKYKMR